VEGGELEQLTEVSGAVGEFRWAPDGRRIAFVMTDPPTEAELHATRERRAVRVLDERLKYARLYLVEVASPADKPRPVRPLTRDDLHVGGHVGAGMGGPAFDWSPDGAAIVFAHTPSPIADDWVHADVSIVDIATGQIRRLAATEAAEGGVAWSPSGRWIALTASDVPASYGLSSRVVLVSPTTGEMRSLAESWDARPTIVGWVGDSRGVLISESRGTVLRLSMLPTDGGPPIDLSPDTLMVSGPVLDASGTIVGFISESWNRAPEAFVSQITPFEPRQLTSYQLLPEAPLGKTERFEWTTSDGQRIEGLLTYPVDYRPGTRVPLLVVVHGGPPGFFVNTFIGRVGSYPVAAFAARGFAVLRPNVRGSSGYGREFRFANYRDWGGGDFRDIMDGVNALVALGVADPDRLGIMGWSYGGYLTAFAITQTTRFRAASVGAGITNLVSFTGTADIPGFVPDFFRSEFWDEPKLWAARSPITNVAGVTTPTLIQHGEEDLRVPVSQGYEFYTALKRRGVPVSMVVYPRQGHSVGEPKLQLDVMRRNLEWFERWLKDGQ
jgi:dipeptidyl aminopeptidase/acylaminoacyl peptidase